MAMLRNGILVDLIVGWNLAEIGGYRSGVGLFSSSKQCLINVSYLSPSKCLKVIFCIWKLKYGNSYVMLSAFFAAFFVATVLILGQILISLVLNFRKMLVDKLKVEGGDYLAQWSFFLRGSTVYECTHRPRCASSSLVVCRPVYHEFLLHVTCRCCR